MCLSPVFALKCSCSGSRDQATVEPLKTALAEQKEGDAAAVSLEKAPYIIHVSTSPRLRSGAPFRRTKLRWKKQ